MLALILPCPAARADEGWWPLDAVPKEAIQARYSFEVQESWLQRARRGALRIRVSSPSAPVQILSGAIISVNGLVLTAAPTLRGCPAEGALVARRLEDELRCPGVRIEVLESIEVLDALPSHRRARARLLRTCPFERCALTSLHANAHRLHRYEVYKDVRLVFAPPPEDIEEFPVVVLRLYEDNKPAKARNVFRLRRKPLPSEPTLVFALGHPDKSARRATFAKLQHLRKVALPAQLASVTGAADAADARDAQVKRGLERALKTLQDPTFIEKARRRELRVLHALHEAKAQKLLRAWPALEDLLAEGGSPAKEAQLQRLVEAAHHQVLGSSLYPDGTKTLRLSYGKLNPEPRVLTTALARGQLEEMPMYLEATTDIGIGSEGGPVFDRRGILLGSVVQDALWERNLQYTDAAPARVLYVQAILHILERRYSASTVLKELR